MRLLIDENVPRSVWEFFEERGHEVIHVRKAFGAGTADRIVAKGAANLEVVFVTLNHRHFKALPTMYGGKAGLISLRCAEQHARARMEQHIDRIEWEYKRFASGQVATLCFEVTETSLKTDG